MAQRHIKECSSSLALREMQVKITLRYHFTLVRMAIISKSTTSKCRQGLARLWIKGNPSTLLVEMQAGATTMENSMEFPQKTKNGTAF